MADRRDRRDWWRDEITGGPRDRYFKYRWPLAAVVFLLPILLPAIRHANTPAGILELVLVIVYGASYVVFPMLFFPKRPLAVKLAYAVGILALGWLTMLVVVDGNVFVLLYALAILAFGLPPGWALLFDGLSLGVAWLLVWLHVGAHGSLGDVGTLLGITTAMFSSARLIKTVRRLRAANEEIATLAVSAERERLARDLHDILGHSLTTITVKAGLARRMLESGQEPGRAAAEIHEVEGLARSALADVRATVSDYREVSLSAELMGARAALRAAEIDADLPHAVDNVRPDLQQAFGYVLREAVTNVLRHSGARHVKVRFGKTWLDIEDDGVGASADACGNGLRGLAERLGKLGGTVHAEPRPGGGFLLRAEVRPALEIAS
ncbi:sensor histidine kinase [Amycolatopsis pithecellobii]|uniref:Sensor histidine kinase n=1 Tax=Amycolatopsis pithecellobii TaxID=664692 RepID=A0A6N7YSE8_9PSEU|nr:sensor histidine kinase [Amycolatopsis pithecellobii]MTD54872.1 sensor histidine kinase [Amycolatopsis pithecellobii]